MVLNVLWLLLDVVNVENLDLIKKLIFVQIVAIELQGLVSHLSEIRKVITERVDELVLVHNWYNNEIKSTITDLLHQKSDFFRDIAKLNKVSSGTRNYSRGLDFHIYLRPLLSTKMVQVSVNSKLSLNQFKPLRN